jgi:hypothetical protein
VCTLIELAMADYAPGWSDADVRRYMGQAPSGLIDDLLALRLARAQATGGEAAVVREQQLAQRVQAQRQAGAPLSLAELAVDGRDLRETMGLPEGPIIGSILERLLADVIEEPSLNRRMTLLTRASLILDPLVQGGNVRPRPQSVVSTRDERILQADCLLDVDPAAVSMYARVVESIP